MHIWNSVELFEIPTIRYLHFGEWIEISNVQQIAHLDNMNIMMDL